MTPNSLHTCFQWFHMLLGQGSQTILKRNHMREIWVKLMNCSASLLKWSKKQWGVLSGIHASGGAEVEGRLNALNFPNLFEGCEHEALQGSLVATLMQNLMFDAEFNARHKTVCNRFQWWAHCHVASLLTKVTACSSCTCITVPHYICLQHEKKKITVFFLLHPVGLISQKYNF